MDQLHSDASLLPFLNLMVAGTLHFHLFTNNVATGLNAVLTDFTEEAGTGYAKVAVAGSAFTLQAVSGHIGTVTAPDIAFTPGSSTTFTDYGYYITDSTDTVLLGFALFDAGPIVTPNPMSLTVTPKLALQSKYTV